MKKELVTTVNSVSIILLAENEERLVPIKPICEALGVSFQAQLEKIKSDPILSSTVMLSLTVGADGKSREMSCIPLEFTFGWLFTINPKNVSPEAKDAVTKYKLECYRALFEYFTEPQTFLKQKQEIIDRETTLLQEHKSGYSQARVRMKKTEARLKKVLATTIEDWRANKRQLGLPFEENPEVEDAEVEEDN